MLLRVRPGSQSTQWLGSAGVSWKVPFTSVSKGGNAVEFDKYGFLISLYVSGVLPRITRGSQFTPWLSSAGFSWGLSVFSVSKGEMLSKLKIIVF